MQLRLLSATVQPQLRQFAASAAASFRWATQQACKPHLLVAVQRVVRSRFLKLAVELQLRLFPVQQVLCACKWAGRQLPARARSACLSLQQTWQLASLAAVVCPPHLQRLLPALPPQRLQPLRALLAWRRS